MPDGLHERDALAWAETQADLLRRLAAGELVQAIDWPNVIEEVQDVGLSKLRCCESASLAPPTACPFTLDELLKGDAAALVAKAAN